MDVIKEIEENVGDTKTQEDRLSEKEEVLESLVKSEELTPEQVKEVVVKF